MASCRRLTAHERAWPALDLSPLPVFCRYEERLSNVQRAHPEQKRLAKTYSVPLCDVLSAQYGGLCFGLGMELLPGILCVAAVALLLALLRIGHHGLATHGDGDDDDDDEPPERGELAQPVREPVPVAL